MWTSLRIAALAVRLRLTPSQTRWALLVIRVCSQSGRFTTLDERRRAADIALATCLVESGLRMFANGNNPESMRIAHDAVGWDHGSVGLFQQQVGGARNSTANWGTTAQCMDAAHSTGSFLARLDGLGWAKSNGQLAQAVQGSAFPDRYAQQDRRAIGIRQAAWAMATAATAPAPPKPKSPAVKPPKAGKVLTVRAGDTMDGMARAHGVSARAFRAANPRAGHPAGHPDMIWPGDRLRLP